MLAVHSRRSSEANAQLRAGGVISEDADVGLYSGISHWIGLGLTDTRQLHPSSLCQR
jgi:hypothetical protein